MTDHEVGDMTEDELGEAWEDLDLLPVPQRQALEKQLRSELYVRGLPCPEDAF